MHKILSRLLVAAAAATAAAPAFAVPVVFTPLAGLTGGTLGATGVFKADLSTLGLATILSISIQDSNSGIGGSGSQFSGFDLDAIRLSTTDCADAACAQTAAALPGFDFGAGSLLTPGAQRPPADPTLFGTDGTGLAVDDSVATLGLFDGESTIAIPGAFGFVSLGDGGLLVFNLTAAVSTAGLFLYIGEVGDNGEVAASDIQVSSNRVPEPASLALAGLALAAAAAVRRRA